MPRLAAARAARLANAAPAASRLVPELPATPVEIQMRQGEGIGGVLVSAALQDPQDQRRQVRSHAGPSAPQQFPQAAAHLAAAQPVDVQQLLPGNDSGTPGPGPAFLRSRNAATVCSIAGCSSAAFSEPTLTACSTQPRHPSRHRNRPPRPLSLGRCAADSPRPWLRAGPGPLFRCVCPGRDSGRPLGSRACRSTGSAAMSPALCRPASRACSRSSFSSPQSPLFERPAPACTELRESSI